MMRAPNALALPTMGQPNMGYMQPVVFNETSLSRLEPLNPTLRELMMETERRADAAGINFEITEGMRDAARQAELVAQGASQTMNSLHLSGNAADIHILNPDGSVNWDFEAYRPIADIAKTVAAEMGIPDFVWGGDWRTLRDGVHFQVGGGQTSPGTDYARGGNSQPTAPTMNAAPGYTPGAPQSAPQNALALAEAQNARALEDRRQNALNALSQAFARPVYDNVMKGSPR
jgi:peptidoglycan L-alanyl-D-glutamate endopeptidase CwlK